MVEKALEDFFISENPSCESVIGLRRLIVNIDDFSSATTASVNAELQQRAIDRGAVERTINTCRTASDLHIKLNALQLVNALVMDSTPYCISKEGERAMKSRNEPGKQRAFDDNVCMSDRD